MKKTIATVLLLLVAITILVFAVACTETDDDLATDNGVRYTCSGQKFAINDRFIINKNFTMTFEEGQFTEEFNRMEFAYSSTEPLRVQVFYGIDGEEKTETFFWEKGENVVFGGLISTYLDGDEAKDIYSLKIDTCTGENADFRLKSIFAEWTTVCGLETYYMTTERYKVGVRLNWGGGIDFIMDMDCPVRMMTNLVNNHDAGRLVQQSYYGTTGNDEYTPGTFNGSQWAYNPVQGGDMYGNPSRLIDIKFGPNYVYVKSQPQDWALDNQLTSSYMENTYTIEEDYIRVDNGFVDFSGWEHAYRHQELPAFYTVSYLGRFTWYDGENSWTDDVLSYRDDLNFWGDPEYAEDCRIFIKENNTETWCAWTSPDGEYGIGMYVPNVDCFYAGRNQYDGSRFSATDSTNYVAPLNLMKITSYEKISYSYMITTGSVEEIRNTFKENKDFADNASLHSSGYQSMRIASDK